MIRKPLCNYVCTAENCWIKVCFHGKHEIVLMTQNFWNLYTILKTKIPHECVTNSSRQFSCSHEGVFIFITPGDKWYCEYLFILRDVLTNHTRVQYVREICERLCRRHIAQSLYFYMKWKFSSEFLTLISPRFILLNRYIADECFILGHFLKANYLIQ